MSRQLAEESLEAGLDLERALRRFSDPSLVQELDRLHRYSVIGLIDFSSPANMSAHKLKDRYWEIRAKVVAAFVAKLRAGELVASGFLLPYGPASDREPITGRLWQILEPDFEKSEAVGENLRYSHVLVMLPVRAPPRRPLKFEHAENFNWVRIRGEHFDLNGGQRAIVRCLWEASRTDNPWVENKRILSDASYSPGTRTVRDAFKHKKDWWKLIDTSRRGYCRLKLDKRDA